MKVSTIKKAFTILMIIATMSLSFNMLLSGTALATGTPAMPSIGQVTSEPLKNTTEAVLGIVSYLCYAAAIILLIMLGIKYMSAAPEGKAEIKKMAITYVVGAVLVFAAGVILTFLSTIANDTVKT